MPRLKAALGQEHVYISASDSQRHFNSEIIIGAFILHLIAGAVKAAIDEIAKDAGKDAWSNLKRMFHKLETDEVSDHESETNAIATADKALATLGHQLAEAATTDFIETTRESIEQNLIAKNFPATKARRIAKEFSNILKERISHV